MPTYRWRLPYRPRGFARDAPLHFECSVDVDRELCEQWVQRNEEIGNESGFDGFYWEHHVGLWVVESVVEAWETFDPLLEQMESLFMERVEDPEQITEADAVSYMMAFVHQFPYSNDSHSAGIAEYARFPIETLSDRTGDCECLSILLAAMLHRAGVAPVAILRVHRSQFLAETLRHAAVGVADQDGSLSGTYITHDGVPYYFCEATGGDGRVGSMSADYRGGDWWVYPIDD